MKKSLIRILAIACFSAIAQASFAQSWRPIGGSNLDGTATRFSALVSTSSTPDGGVLSMYKIGSDIYTGGFFYGGRSGGAITISNGVGKFTPSSATWASGIGLPQSTPSEIAPAEFVDGVCDFKDAGGNATIAACGLIQLDASQPFVHAAYLDKTVTPNKWKTIYDPATALVTGIPACIAYYNDLLYIGGNFMVLSTGTHSSLLTYNVTTGQLQPVANAPIGLVLCFKVDGSNLYIGGSFTKETVTTTIPPTATITQNIVAYRKTSTTEIYSNVGNTVITSGPVSGTTYGVPLPVYCINTVQNNLNQKKLVIGTAVTDASTGPVAIPASTCIGPPEVWKYVCLSYPQKVEHPTLGGVWILDNGTGTTKIWNNIGLTNSTVLALDEYSRCGVNTLIAGGDFTSINGLPANYITEGLYTSSTSSPTSIGWSNLGGATDMNSTVLGVQHQLTTAGNELIIGGLFTSAGTYSVNKMAKFVRPSIPCKPAGPTSISDKADNRSDCHISYTQDILTVTIPEMNNELISLSIFDVAGKKIESKKVLISDEGIKEELTLRSNGMYLVNIIYENGQKCSNKILKTSE